MFYLVNLRLDRDGAREPALAEDVDYLVLAEPGAKPSSALIESQGLDLDDLPTVQPVDEPLNTLLCSAAQYGPAMALMREQIRPLLKQRYPGVQQVPSDAFCAALIDLLRFHLQRQQHMPYFLAEARVDQTGYLTHGGFYWIVGYDMDEKAVLWVSDDYNVYGDPPSAFGLDDATVRAQFNEVPSPYQPPADL